MFTLKCKESARDGPRPCKKEKHLNNVFGEGFSLGPLRYQNIAVIVRVSLKEGRVDPEGYVIPTVFKVKTNSMVSRAN